MIAIKNMEMPSCCGKCPLAESEYVLGLDSFYCNITDKMVDENERDNDCPLVEIITCKNCKHREKLHQNWMSNKKVEVYFCTLQSDEYCYEVEDDYFCAYGRRRE